ncbi:hypothetical protein QZH41_005614 [Actinostola sp. cb2023]|nr:hypothetical protein QZH41_005614 [Actinostola sp. cb2023]
MSLQEFTAFQKHCLSKNLEEIEKIRCDEKKQQEEIALKIKTDGEKAIEQVKKITQKLVKTLRDHEQQLLNQIQSSITKADRNVRIIRHTPAAKEYIQNIIDNGIASDMIDMQDSSKQFTYNPFKRDISGIVFDPNEDLSQQVNIGPGEVRFCWSLDPMMSTVQVDSHLEATKKAKLTVMMKTSTGQVNDELTDDNVDIQISPEDDVQVKDKQMRSGVGLPVEAPTLKMQSGRILRLRLQIAFLQRMRPVPAAKIITEGSNHMAYQDETSHIVLFLHKPCRRKVMSSCDREKKTFERTAVCYGRYGCFTNNSPFNRPLIPLPQPPNEMGMTYYLVTRADPSGQTIINDHDVTKLQASSYDGSKRTVIIIHGWVENPETSVWITKMKKALVEKEDVNVIVAGWKEGAFKLYTISVANTRLVGSMCPFRSYDCENWDKFTHGNCMTCGKLGCPEMGHNAIKYKGLADGNFYLYSNEERPYCVHRYTFVTFTTNGRLGAGGQNPRIRIYGTKGNTGEIQLEKRLLQAGSNEKFVAPIKADLGSLTSIDVWHSNPLSVFDVWRPDKVTVEFVDSHKWCLESLPMSFFEESPRIFTKMKTSAFYCLFVGLFLLDYAAPFLFPKIKLPKIELPKIKLPKIELPKIKLPKIKFPKIELPHLFKVCHGKYGCFDNKAPFNRRWLPIFPLPQSPNIVGTTYHVITKEDQSGRRTINDEDASKLYNSGYDGSKKTVIIIHGWTENSRKTPWVKKMGKTLTDHEDANVIEVNWAGGARQLYDQATANTRLVGSQVAELIKFLNRNTQNSPQSFHVIGFSLGAQIAGYVGRRLKEVKLGRITGSAIPDPGFVIPDPGFVIPDPGFVIPDPGFVIPDPGFVISDP